MENLRRNDWDERLIKIYQSKAYQTVVSEETVNLYTIEDHAEVNWTDAIEGEQYDTNIQNKVQCEKSLTFMRTQMINEEVNALVCIGGMEGVEREFELFRKYHPQKPIYLLKTTGGASKILADKFLDLKNVKIIDAQYYERSKDSIDIEIGKMELIPFLFITAMIVKEIISNDK